jgi:hypothetical protein
MESSFETWRAVRSNRESPVFVQENIAIFSYAHDSLIYTRLGNREYELNGVPLAQATTWYPQLVMRMFQSMRKKIERGYADMLSRAIKIRGVRYSLHAKQFGIQRLGKICAFTCSQITKPSPRDAVDWHTESFDRWFHRRLQPVPAQFASNAMWCCDIAGMSDHEILTAQDRGTPRNARPATDLLEEMLTSRALHIRERRVGRQGAPYALSFFRVPHLDLMILQRERLSR